MPLRRKLLLAMLIPALLLGMVGGVGIYSLHHLEQAAGRILADNYRSIQETRRMERALRYLSTHEVDRSTGGEAEASPDEFATNFEQALQRCESNITESGESAVLGRIRSKWNSLHPDLVRWGDLPAERRRAHRRAVED